ncbi:MAG TPA: anti-sigma factor [Pyrinomonadaceae bacterium]|nr:anti-sigma factor [Pyrinomonadaceae bacterium]
MKSNLDERTIERLCDAVLASEHITLSDTGSISTQLTDAELREAEKLELAASALMLATLDELEPMPSHVKARLRVTAQQFLDENASPSVATQPLEAATHIHDEIIATPQRRLFDWLGWAIAAIACVVLGINLYLTRTDNNALIVQNPTPTPVSTPTLAQQREMLIQTAPDVRIAEFKPGNVKGLEGLRGDIVWSDSKQAGFMRFSNLPKNDPEREAYQLWIFDETQKPETPIDGGVFDITADGEVIIPITPKLRAKNPSAFAVTIEKPGGVVVSSREKIAALARVKQNQT